MQIGYLSPPFSTLGSWVRQVCSKNIVGKEEKQIPFSPQKQNLSLGLSSEGSPGKGGREWAAKAVSGLGQGTQASLPFAAAAVATVTTTATTTTTTITAKNCMGWSVVLSCLLPPFPSPKQAL